MMIIKGARTVHPMMVPDILDNIRELLGVEIYPIGSTACPYRDSKDVDILVDSNEITEKYGFKNPRDAIVHICRTNDLETVQKGVSVHVKYPYGVGFIQVDVMVTEHASEIQFFHVHRIPKWSPYKGRHRHILLNHLARKKSLKWSPYRGLVDRKSDRLITRDPDEVAQLLIGENAYDDNITSADAILSALPDSDSILKELLSDPAWNN